MHEEDRLRCSQRRPGLEPDARRCGERACGGGRNRHGADRGHRATRRARTRARAARPRDRALPGPARGEPVVQLGEGLLGQGQEHRSRRCQVLREVERQAPAHPRQHLASQAGARPRRDLHHRHRVPRDDGRQLGRLGQGRQRRCRRERQERSEDRHPPRPHHHRCRVLHAGLPRHAEGLQPACLDEQLRRHRGGLRLHRRRDRRLRHQRPGAHARPQGLRACSRQGTGCHL